VVNGGFEDGDSAWTKDAGWSIGQFGTGTHFHWHLVGAVELDRHRPHSSATTAFTVQFRARVITATAQVQQGASSAGQAGGARRNRLVHLRRRADFVLLGQRGGQHVEPALEAVDV
jgi:hypothetical protein